MRLIAVNDLHDNVWTEYIYQTTWKNGWNDLLYYVSQ